MCDFIIATVCTFRSFVCVWSYQDYRSRAPDRRDQQLIMSHPKDADNECEINELAQVSKRRHCPGIRTRDHPIVSRAHYHRATVSDMC